MGTHPIFESDFDCLTEKIMKLSFALLGAAAASMPSYTELANVWWEEASGLFNYANSHWAEVSAGIDNYSFSNFEGLWNLCNKDGDAIVSIAEAKACGKLAADWGETPEDIQMYIYRFLKKYWHIVDPAGDGLDNREFKILLGGMALVDSLVTFHYFDENADGLMTASELGSWVAFSEHM